MIKKLITLIIGILAGTGAGVAGVALFVPETSAELRQRIKDGFNETLIAAREASAQKRAELEAELASLTRSTNNHGTDSL
jgi:gas vesicle protein